ncbi:uncharacterized protein [Cardiocondyla obscurior]|uniref:uncharacterized protein n=1 Tax=Cardiocondyla obscurior TaxID=286306 RepID=UPI0039655FC7
MTGVSIYTASALHTNGKIGRDGFLTWLKDIFNKCAEDKSRKADTAIVDRAVTATTFNRPEIAASMRPADSSDKADVINQKLANFCAVQSMTKFEYGNIRAEKRETASSERAYVKQQSAIHATSQSSRFAAGKTFEREIGLDPSCRGPGEMYRSWRNGGAIQLAARNDFNAASHYRCYTSPTNCYRPPPRRAKQPLLGLRVPHGHIDVPRRAMVGFGPRNTKPPIKKSNAPEKHEKDERKDKKKRENPAIRTGESADSSENRTEMTVNDNPRCDPDAAFRYEWGVKLSEEQASAEAANDNDKFEKGQRYVTKRLWGVNLKEPKPDIAPQTTANFGRATKRPQNTSSISENGDSLTREAKNDATAAQKNSTTTSSLKDTTAEFLSIPSTGLSNDFIAAKEKSGDASSYMSSKELREIMRTSPNMLTETIVVNDEFNIPEEVNSNTVIAAWQNFAARSVSKVKENYFSSSSMENLEMLSIRPEAPQPKLDVQVVKSTEDSETTELSDSGCTSLKSTEIKRIKPLRKPGGYSISKKLHTINTPTRYLHRYMNSIIKRRVELSSSNFASVVRIKTKCPEGTSAFPTSFKDTKKAIDESESHKRDKQQINLKTQNEEKCNNLNSNNILNNDRSFPPVESPTLSSSNQEQADIDFAKTLDVIADKETEISINQLQNSSRKKIAYLANSTTVASVQKDKSRYKDEDAEDEIKKIYEEPRANYASLHNAGTTYVDFNDPSTDNGSIKSDAIKSAKVNPRFEDGNNVTFDSSVKNVDEDGDSYEGYIIDGDYVRLPGDPYPYSRENLDKWRVPPYPKLYKPWTPELSRSFDPPAAARSTLRNANDAYANAAGKPRDSHAGDAVMETSGSDGGAGARKRTGQANGFHVSSRDQRVVSDCLRDDAADTLGLRQCSEAFSRLDADEKINEVARSGDNVPFRALYVE